MFIKKNEYDISQFFSIAEQRKHQYRNSNRSYLHKPEGSELELYTNDSRNEYLDEANSVTERATTPLSLKPSFSKNAKGMQKAATGAASANKLPHIVSKSKLKELPTVNLNLKISRRAAN